MFSNTGGTSVSRCRWFWRSLGSLNYFYPLTKGIFEGKPGRVWRGRSRTWLNRSAEAISCIILCFHLCDPRDANSSYIWKVLMLCKPCKSMPTLRSRLLPGHMPFPSGNIPADTLKIMPYQVSRSLFYSPRATMLGETKMHSSLLQNSACSLSCTAYYFFSNGKCYLQEFGFQDSNIRDFNPPGLWFGKF